MRGILLVVLLSGCATTPSPRTENALFRDLDPKVYDAIQPYRVTKDADMPWAYQRANPQGRPLHDDWAILKDTPRINTAYKVPLPFRITKGASIPTWIPWDPSYPQSPDLHTRAGGPTGTEALVDYAGPGDIVYSAYIGGKWSEVFWQYQSTVDGKNLLLYHGLKQDLTVNTFADGRVKSDLMAWFPEMSGSWK